MDLGTKREDSMPMAVSEPQDRPDVIYPSFQLSDEAAESFRKEHPDIEVGTELSVTMKLRVTGIHESAARYDSGQRVEFDCLSLDSVKPGADDGGGDENEEDENPAVRKLMAKQKA